MSRAKIWAIVAIAFVGFAFGPTARADVFQLNANYCGCIPTSLGGVAGTVTVNPAGANSVDIAVSLNSPLQFHQTTGLDAFSFNVVGFSGLTASSFTINNPGGSSWTLLPGPNHEDGAGTFMYSLQCTVAPNGCAVAPVRTLDFTITATGITTAAVESTNNGASNVDFAANVANPNLAGCTGLVGAGNGTANSTASGTTRSDCVGGTVSRVPEPTSMTLFGTGLLGLVFLRKRAHFRTK